ncbi:MAG: nucleotidyltransferase family protein [Ketobacteraceae bacterium]|nr:nucleotidyltransferase family protein [Ketobacteraceae bacterium]
MKVMLLAAGRGERMGALTETCPKPLLEVAGKPLLSHHLERLGAAGFTDVVINTSYLGDQIREYVGDGSRWQLRVQCTHEPERLETAGGIINALPLLGSAPFLVVNSDVWTDYPLENLKQDITGLAHLVLVDNPPHNPGGDFALEAASGKVRDPDDQAAGTSDSLTFSGLSVLSPRLFAGAEPGRRALAPVLKQAMAKGRVTGEHYQGQWVDVGTPERLEAVATLIRNRAENSQHRSQSCR